MLRLGRREAITVAGVVIALALPPAAPASAGSDRSHGCPAFTVGSHRVIQIRAHLATCPQVHRIIGAWARGGFRSSGPPVYQLWSCYFLAPRHTPECSAGLNGYVRFRLTRR